MTQPALDPRTVHRTVLPNGLTVLVREDHAAPVVAIVTYVNAGYFDETDDVVGIAHVLEHMYFKGTPSRGPGEIARQTKAVGGYLNAGTIYDHTSYYAVLPSSGFAAGLDVQFDAYANSLIEERALASEIEVIVEEAKRKADNPGAVTVETLYELLHDCHRIRRWRIGREPGLRALTRDHVLAFYRNFYKPSNTILAIAGDVDPAAALHDVTQRYGTLAGEGTARNIGPQEEQLPSFRYRELAGDVAQAQFAIGWRTPGSLDPETPHLDLLGTVLGSGRASRLYRAVRERSLVQGISAYDYTPTEIGVFLVHAETRPELVRDALRATWAELDAIRRSDPDPMELERAKRLYESRWLRRFETMEGQANYLAEWESLGGWQLGDRYLDALLRATPRQVRQVAEEWLDPGRASVVTYRPASAPEVAPTAEALRAMLDDAAPAMRHAVAPPRSARVERSPEVELEREEAGVHVFRTAEGVPILVRRKPGSAIAHAGIYFLGGATEEPAERAGLTSLLVRTSIKGTTTRSAAQVAEEGELLGGSVGGGAGGDSFGWSISVPVRRLDAAVELLADVVQNPAFADDAVATERAIAVADVIAMRDDMSRYPMRMATAAAFAGHPYGVPSSGTETSLATLDAGALRAWHEAQVLGRLPVAAVVGDLEPESAARAVARALGEWSAGEPPMPSPAAWRSAGARVHEERDKKQSALVLLYPGPARNDERRFAAQLMVGIASGLGGRFFDELRDRQALCYTVQAFQSDRRLGGSIGAYIATSPEKEDAARAGLLRELTRFREAPVTPEELERARTYAIGTHAIRQQNGGAVLAELVDAWLFGTLDELDRYVDQLRAVTAENIRAVAMEFLVEELRVEAVLRGARPELSANRLSAI